MSASQTFYDVLGIDWAASSEEVKKAYRHKALETHPDKLTPPASLEEKETSEQNFRTVEGLLSFLKH